MNTNLCEYNCLMVGVGPDTWDNEFSVEAVDILEAARLAMEKAQYSGGWVVSIEQID